MPRPLGRGGRLGRGRDGSLSGAARPSWRSSAQSESVALFSNAALFSKQSFLFSRKLCFLSVETLDLTPFPPGLPGAAGQ